MADAPLSVVFVCESLAGIGGTEYMVLAFGTTLVRLGVGVSVVAPGQARQVWRETARCAGVTLRMCASGRDVLPTVRDECAHNGARIVQFVPWNGQVERWCDAPPAGVATVVIEPTSAAPSCWWLRSSRSEGVDTFVVLTSAARDALQSVVAPVPVAVASNTLIATPRAELMTPPRRVVAASRLSQEKGLDVLIAAMSMLPRSCDDVELHVWGEGPERQRLDRLAAMLGVSERLRFRGVYEPVHGVGAAMAGAWVGVLPSMFEGLPIVLLEWMALGLPIVATATTGARAALGDGYAHLTPVADSRAMADAIASLLDDPRRLRDASRAVSERSLRFAPEETGAALTRVYREVLRA